MRFERSLGDQEEKMQILLASGADSARELTTTTHLEP